MKVHEIKYLAMIFNDCDDYKVKVWSPEFLREGTLIFTGCNNVDKTIHFNVNYTKDTFIAQRAFNETMKKLVESGFDIEHIDWEKVFTSEVVKISQGENK